MDGGKESSENSCKKWQIPVIKTNMRFPSSILCPLLFPVLVNLF
jgi:hypothetical protein